MAHGVQAMIKMGSTGLFLLITALIASSLVVPVFGQEGTETSAEPKPAKLFSSDETLKITLHAPWRDIIRNEKNQNPYPGTIEFTDSLGRSNSIPLTVERRGKSRQVVCTFPPIKLVLEKEAIKGTAFRGQTSLKLTTHCDKGDRWEQYYVKEMLAYRMYNLITPLSFRVQPLSVTYVDSKVNSREEGRFAFFTEDVDDMADRNGMKRLATTDITRGQLEANEASRFALFQLMIANTDFEQTSGPDPAECCHNARLIGLDETQNIHSVPYDFDSAGLIDTDYAAPSEKLPIKNVTQRLYRGFCAHNSTLEAARQEYLAKEQAIYDLVRNESLLSTRSESAMLKYLAAFFEILRDQEKYDKTVIQKCRK